MNTTKEEITAGNSPAVRGTAAGRILMLATAVLWGLAGVCVKSIGWGTMSVVAARSVISLVMLLIVKRTVKVRITFWNVMGAVMMSATGMLYVQSIKLTTAGTAIVLQYIAPILVLLFAVLFQHRRVKISELLITAAVFGGIVLSFADDLDATHVMGNILGLASGFTFAGQIIIMNRPDTDSEDSLLISCFLSLIISLPFVFFDQNLVFDVKNIVWVLILGVFQYGLANVLFGFGIQKVDKVEASLILTIEPIFNPIPVAIFCGEKMGPLAIIGFAIVIFFVTLFGLLPKIEAKLNSRKA
ncbi:MAG: DMT family transporter [Clostridia bacterium]|nr:DMT family transporter [Clostridia bacterium]